MNVIRAPDWNVTLSPLGDPAALEAKWLALQTRVSCSFFQSWGWLGSWIEALPEPLRPHVLEVRLDGELAGLALLGCHHTWRHGMIPSKRLLLSETGDERFDCLTVEHNGFLIDGALSTATLREGLSGLVKLRAAWDELFVSGIVRATVEDYAESARHANLRTSIALEKPYHFVNCDMIRQTGSDYLALLGRNTRSQLRRALRGYEERGVLSFHVADTLEKARDFFDKLRELHQQYWVSKGQPGAFGSDFALRFHRSLIRRRFSEGEIQLAEIRAGTQPIGYLYNFVHDRVVYNYQSAFRYESDPRLKPGFVSHYLAVRHSVNAGMRTYDFLMGNQRFKESLATDRGRMAWLVLQKPRIRFALEQAALTLRQRLLNLRASPRSPTSATGEGSAIVSPRVQ
jgi:CelD/BcsL family acetyltransferase involved in cellulose biosynthesis